MFVLSYNFQYSIFGGSHVFYGFLQFFLVVYTSQFSKYNNVKISKNLLHHLYKEINIKCAVSYSKTCILLSFCYKYFSSKSCCNICLIQNNLSQAKKNVRSKKKLLSYPNFIYRTQLDDPCFKCLIFISLKSFIFTSYTKINLFVKLKIYNKFRIILIIKILNIFISGILIIFMIEM